MNSRTAVWPGLRQDLTREALGWRNGRADHEGRIALDAERSDARVIRPWLACNAQAAQQPECVERIAHPVL
jgi:hypothetical protein